MWLCRFRTRNARPIGAGRIRFITGPPSTKISLTNSRSTSTWSSRFSALAIADFRHFCTCRAAALLVTSRMFTASCTPLPRIRSATSRTFCAEPGA